ncbi:Reducing polyketide synthase FUB1 [Zalerion maritima]|uniref:Reducing polyketide synthase FUB1 n=1 Tax=Zalerion maritima TaxID=339359 RepID=A0AAD5RM58_9PEZI|nr:Reducing polyketide synthase FUB1 [Zalerion maritima]
MVLEDSIFDNMTLEQWRRASRPRVHGTMNLHNASSAEPLAFFSLLSSITRVIGSPAQSNHAASNTIEDANCKLATPMSDSAHFAGPDFDTDAYLAMYAHGRAGAQCTEAGGQDCSKQLVAAIYSCTGGREGGFTPTYCSTESRLFREGPRADPSQKETCLNIPSPNIKDPNIAYRYAAAVMDPGSASEEAHQGREAVEGSQALAERWLEHPAANAGAATLPMSEGPMGGGPIRLVPGLGRRTDEAQEVYAAIQGIDYRRAPSLIQHAPEDEFPTQTSVGDGALWCNYIIRNMLTSLPIESFVRVASRYSVPTHHTADRPRKYRCEGVESNILVRHVNEAVFDVAKDW